MDFRQYAQKKAVNFVIYDRLSALCEKHGKKITPVVIQLGLSRGNLKNWQKGSTINSDVLIKLADYFDISVDYLLGRTDKPEVNR